MPMRRCPLRSTWLRSRTRGSNARRSGSRSKKSSPLTQRPVDDFMAGASLFDRFVEYCTSTSLLSTVLLTTIPLTRCSGSRARPTLARWARIVRRTGLGRGRGCLFSSVRPGSSAEAAGSATGRSRRSPGASDRMRRNRRIRRQGGRPVHCRAATGPAPSRTVTETGTRMTWERRVLTNGGCPARLGPSWTCCGPLGGETQAFPRAPCGFPGEAASSGSNPTLMR